MMYVCTSLPHCVCHQFNLTTMSRTRVQRCIGSSVGCQLTVTPTPGIVHDITTAHPPTPGRANSVFPAIFHVRSRARRLISHIAMSGTIWSVGSGMLPHERRRMTLVQASCHSGKSVWCHHICCCITDGKWRRTKRATTVRWTHDITPLMFPDWSHRMTWDQPYCQLVDNVRWLRCALVNQRAQRNRLLFHPATRTLMLVARTEQQNSQQSEGLCSVDATLTSEELEEMGKEENL